MGFNLTTFLGLKKPTTGTPGSEWPGHVNGNMDTIDSEIANRHKKNEDIEPDAADSRRIGFLRRILSIFTQAITADSITLGGVSRSTWPSAVAGSNGQVFQTGSITLNGQDGVTVTHNRGNTSYLVKVSPTGITAINKVGDIVYVKAANTVAIYNSGQSNLAADIELSAIA